MTHLDIVEGLRLCRASLWNQIEDDWLFFLRVAGGGGWLVERDGATAGSVAVLRYGGNFSWLSMMLVDPGKRRSGVGSQLMETALEALASESCVRLDATPSGEPLYRRSGFVPEYGLARTRLTVAAEQLCPTRAKARPMESEDFPDVFTLDREVFGADRTALLRSFYERNPRFAWVTRDGASLAGYCFGRSGYLYNQLGPLVATTGEAARELVAHCLAGQEGCSFALDTPLAQAEWLSWLQSIGFVVERPFLRMRRGENHHPGVPDFQFGIAGPEFG